MGLAARVRVHGRVSSERLRELYRSADTLLLCSKYEGYGMVLAEGLAAGLPIVATRVGAVPEVVGDGQGAELVAPGDVAGLARALTMLADDSVERKRRAELARQRAAQLPSWSESVAAFDEMLRHPTRSR
jgi:glycosyltransferase involved in cell wall biosynthesis